MRRSTRFLVSAAACYVIIACASTAVSHSADGVGRSGGGRVASVCPTDVRGETRRCLGKYMEQLEALEKADDRFFPGLDVEVIRSLCSMLEESVKCAQSLNDACQKTQVVTIEEEFSPHLSVSQLCSQNNIYEDYAMNQNCFHRIKTESKLCHQRFQQSTTTDQQRSSSSSSSLSSSSSSSSYSQRYHTQQQQRQYCSQMNQLIVCVQNEVLKNQNSCSRTALTLVGSLVRASLTSSIVCSEAENATSSSTAGKSGVVVVPSPDNSRPSAAAVHRPDGGWHFAACSAAAAVLYLTSVLSSSSSSSSSSSVTLSHPPPPPHRSRRRRHHHLK